MRVFMRRNWILRTRAYAVNVVYLLLNNNQDADAKQLAQKSWRKRSRRRRFRPARDLLERVREHERWAMQRNTPPSVTADATVSTKTAAASAPAEGQAMTVLIDAGSGPEDPHGGRRAGARGRLCAQNCGYAVYDCGGSAVSFHAGDFRTIGVTGAAESVMSWSHARMEGAAGEDLVSGWLRGKIFGGDYEFGRLSRYWPANTATRRHCCVSPR